MKIRMNGNEIDFSLEGESSLGEVLASLDAWLDHRGYLMTGIRADGTDIAGDIDARRGENPSSIRELDLIVEPNAPFRLAALGACADWFGRVASAASSHAPGAEDRAGALAREGREILATKSGLLTDEEISFAEYVVNSIGACAGTGEKTDCEALGARANQLELLFASRISEIEDPASALADSCALYAAERDNLSGVPVLLQTGRETDAMSAVVRFTELFSKATRAIPPLCQSGIDLTGIAIEGKRSGDFHREINALLEELTGAFIDRDTVMIGDLIEYELLPRLDSLFAAFKDALESAKEGEGAEA